MLVKSLRGTSPTWRVSSFDLSSRSSQSIRIRQVNTSYLWFENDLPT